VPLKPFTDWLLAFTMFGIGCLLSVRDFMPILRKPAHILMGTAANIYIWNKAKIAAVNHPLRDRFVLFKGYAALAFYVVFF